jgi:methyltransferase (TIGR00027 family)
LRLYRAFSRGFLLPGLQPTGMQLRTQFVDAEVTRALSDGVNQVVVVGAGYDARSLRFRQPGVRWFEVDHPATQPDKRRRMQHVCADLDLVEFVAADLSVDDIRSRLEQAGHDASRRSLFVCEGLFAYLPQEVVSSLCERLFERAAPRSVLVASVLVVPAGRRGPLQAAVDVALAAMGERRQGIFHPGDVEVLFGDAGWVVARRATTGRRRVSGSHLLLLAGERS